MSKESIVKSWKNLKSQIDNFVKNNNVSDLKKDVTKRVQTIQKEVLERYFI